MFYFLYIQSATSKSSPYQIIDFAHALHLFLVMSTVQQTRYICEEKITLLKFTPSKI